MTTTWKVIYVASRQEKKTAMLLEKVGIRYYLPLVKSMRQWSDRKKVVEVPLFNGYMFVMPNDSRRDEVVQIPGVVKYLRYNNQDATVTEAELKIVKSIVTKGYDISEFDPDMEYSPGETVLIVQGPLKNFRGEIVRIGTTNYALISFENFGQSYKVKIPKEIIKKIG